MRIDMTRIYLVRHGENLDNLEGILNGHRDRALTEKWRAQAKSLWEKLLWMRLEIDYHYCSPLSRAKETAEIVSKISWLVSPVIENDLIERDFWSMTGTLAADIPSNYKKDDLVVTQLVTYFPNPEQGESFDDNIIRAEKLLQNIFEKHPGDNIMLTGHWDCSKSIYCAFYKIPRQEWIINFNMYNTDVVALEEWRDPKNAKL